MNKHEIERTRGAIEDQSTRMQRKRTRPMFHSNESTPTQVFNDDVTVLLRLWHRACILLQLILVGYVRKRRIYRTDTE